MGAASFGPQALRGIATFGTPAWRRLFGAHVISSLGDECTRIALFARVYELGGQIEGLAGVAIAQFLPSIVFAPLAGVLADRGGRKQWLVITDFARAPVLVGIAVAGSLATVIALTAVHAALTAVFRPVEAAIEPDLLPGADDQGSATAPDVITRANAIRVGVRQILGILGPLFVGLLLETAGTRAALIVDAATYAVSGVVLLGLRVPQVEAAVFADVGAAVTARTAGFRVVIADPGYRLVFLAQAAIVLLLGMQGPLFYDFSAVALGGGGGVFAALMAALGVGSLAGAVVLSRWSPGRRRVDVLFGVLAIDGAALFVFSYARQLGVALVCMAIMGLISAASRVFVRSYLQSAPAEIRGRVLGVFEGVQGPLAVVSLAALVPLTGNWSSALILRGLSLGEIGIAVAALTALLRWTSRLPSATLSADREGATDG
jgi:hypothetical protein